MLELMVKLNPRFTKKEKKNCIPLIKKMTKLIALARNKGLLTVEEKMESETDTFLKAAMPFITDAICAPDEIEPVLSCMIVAGGYEGEQLLRRLIMAQGIVFMQNGVNEKIARRLLFAMLGEEYLNKYVKPNVIPVDED